MIIITSSSYQCHNHDPHTNTTITLPWSSSLHPHTSTIITSLRSSSPLSLSSYQHHTLIVIIIGWFSNMTPCVSLCLLQLKAIAGIDSANLTEIRYGVPLWWCSFNVRGFSGRFSLLQARRYRGGSQLEGEYGKPRIGSNLFRWHDNKRKARLHWRRPRSLRLDSRWVWLHMDVTAVLNRSYFDLVSPSPPSCVFCVFPELFLGL